MAEDTTPRVETVSLVAPSSSPVALTMPKPIRQPSGFTTLTLRPAHEAIQVWVPVPAGAAWSTGLRAALQTALRLPSNWDGYGAREPLLDPALALVEILKVSDFSGRAPLVSPLPDGGIHAEWNQGSFGVEVEISATLEVHVLVDDNDAMTEWRGSTGPDPTLRAALSRLA
jgi:hypothetical protein